MKKNIFLSVFFITLVSQALPMKQTQANLRYVLGVQAGQVRKAKSIMVAANRRADLRLFTDLVRRVGLQHALGGYRGKNASSKKGQKFIEMISQGDKITVLAPIGSVMLPMLAKVRSARAAKDKEAIKIVNQEAVDLLMMHILKGELKRADLKGQLETIGGKKIDADKLVIRAGDIEAGNGVLHVIEQLVIDPQATPAPGLVASQVVMPSVAADQKDAKPTTATVAPSSDTQPAVVVVQPAAEPVAEVLEAEKAAAVVK